jgi:ribonuclease HI
LLFKQVTGEWNVNAPQLRERRVTVRELLETFDEWQITHVPRELNERANRLANEALDG